MRAGVVNIKQIAAFDFGQHAVDRKFVVVFAKRAGHIIFVVARCVFFTHNGNVMIRAVHRRTHQVDRAGVHADIFLVGMFFVYGSCDKRTVRTHHKPAELGVNGNIAHACRHENFVIDRFHAFADFENIVRFLVRLIGNADTAGKVDETDIGAGLFFQADGDFKQSSCKGRVIVVCHGVAREESVQTEFFDAFFFQNAIGFKQLFGGHAVFRIAGVIHNAVRNLEVTARIVAAG